MDIRTRSAKAGSDWRIRQGYPTTVQAWLNITQFWAGLSRFFLYSLISWSKFFWLLVLLLYISVVYLFYVWSCHSWRHLVILFRSIAIDMFALFFFILGSLLCKQLLIGIDDSFFFNFEHCLWFVLFLNFVFTCKLFT